MADRYQVRPGSLSAHCCFEATVVDTTRPVFDGDEEYGPEYKTVCETFSVEDAEKVAEALNARAETGPTKEGDRCPM